MRTLIRLFFSIFGYNVYFVKRSESDTVQINNLENQNRAWLKNYTSFENEDSLSFYKSICKKMIDLGFDLNDKTVCDNGCGNGMFLKVLSQAFQVRKIVGYDFSNEAIVLAQKKNIVNSIFKVHDIYLPLSEGEKYDFVFCTEVLEHLEFPETALLNMLKMLNINGVLFITVPNGRFDFYNGHINFWSISSWKVFIYKFVDGTNYNISINFMLKDNQHLYAMIERIK